MAQNVTATIADLQTDNRGISGHQFQVREHYFWGLVRGLCTGWRIDAVSRLGGQTPVICALFWGSGRVWLWSWDLVARVAFCFGSQGLEDHTSLPENQYLYKSGMWLRYQIRAHSFEVRKCLFFVTILCSYNGTEGFCMVQSQGSAVVGSSCLWF